MLYPTRGEIVLSWLNKILNEDMEDREKNKNDHLPSAADDCADVKSKYKKFKKGPDKPKFPPVEYEQPPHH